MASNSNALTFFYRSRNAHQRHPAFRTTLNKESPEVLISSVAVPVIRVFLRNSVVSHVSDPPRTNGPCLIKPLPFDLSAMNAQLETTYSASKAVGTTETRKRTTRVHKSFTELKVNTSSQIRMLNHRPSCLSTHHSQEQASVPILCGFTVLLRAF